MPKSGEWDRQECLSYLRPGDMVEIEITESHDYDLVGRVVEVLDPMRPERAVATATPVERIATGAPLRVLQ